MKMLNTQESAKQEATPADNAAQAETTSILIRVLNPVVPHLCWQLWNELGYAEQYGDLLDTAWPIVDDAALIADEIELSLQVNGKLRGTISVAYDAEKADIEKQATSHSAVLKFLEGREPKRIIVVPGRLVNVVG